MLKKQRLIGANRLRLNRLLLEDAYPLQIAKHQSLDVSFIVGEVSPPREAAIENAIGPVLIRLHKSVLVCDALKFSRTDLNLLATSSTEKCGFIALAFTTLPVALDTTPTTIGTAAKLGDFERLLLLAQLRDLAPGAADLLHHYAALNFADAGSADTARTILATGTRFAIQSRSPGSSSY